MGGIIFKKWNGKLIKYLAKKLGTVFCEGPNERILSHDCPEIIKIFVPYFFFKYSIPLKNKRKMIIKNHFFYKNFVLTSKTLNLLLLNQEKFHHFYKYILLFLNFFCFIRCWKCIKICTLKFYLIFFNVLYKKAN